MDQDSAVSGGRRRAVATRGKHVPALDGIRAVAIIGVLGYHAGLGWLPGGFLGVDMFFVLSGFLITGLLLAERSRTGAIDLVAFWGHRVRRLLPALLLMLVAVVAGGRLLLDPPDFALLRVDALAALAYVANWRMLLRGDGGYFAATALPSPLEHTWSLGIEEQFYLLWPLLLILLTWRARSLRRLVGGCVGGIVGSTLLDVLLFHPGHDPSRIYYGTDTRAVALLSGCLLAALLAGRPVRLSRPGRRLLGALTLVAMAGLSWAWAQPTGQSASLYRGGLLLVALAVTTLLADVSLVPDGVAARLLALPPLPALGRISYGLYLWHWPLFQALTSSRTGLSGPALVTLRVVASLAAAVASYVLVERPIRQRHWPVRLAVPAMGTAVALVGAFVLVDTAVSPPSAVAHAGPVVAISRPPAAAATSPTTKPVDWPVHHRTPGAEPVADFFGDSVAWTVGAYLPPHPGLVTHNAAVQGCGIALGNPYSYIGGLHVTFPQCNHWETTWRQRLGGTNPDVSVILLNRWELVDRVHDGRWEHVGQPDFDAYLTRQLRMAIGLVSAQGAHVVLLTAPYNHRGEKPDGSLYPGDYPSRVDAWNALLRRVAATYATGDVRIVDLGKKVCPDGRFTWTDDGVQVRSDGTHFTPAGVHWFAPWLLPQIAAAAAPASAGR